MSDFLRLGVEMVVDGRVVKRRDGEGWPEERRPYYLLQNQVVGSWIFKIPKGLICKISFWHILFNGLKKVAESEVEIRQLFINGLEPAPERQGEVEYLHWQYSGGDGGCGDSHFLTNYNWLKSFSQWPYSAQTPSSPSTPPPPPQSAVQANSPPSLPLPPLLPLAGLLVLLLLLLILITVGAVRVTQRQKAGRYYTEETR